jgi:hypothetical protein
MIETGDFVIIQIEEKVVRPRITVWPGWYLYVKQSGRWYTLDIAGAQLRRVNAYTRQVLLEERFVLASDGQGG